MATSSGVSTHSQNTQQYSEFEIFDRVYTKGKVWIIPDVRKPKVDFFKPAASPEEDKGQQGLRSQKTQGKTTQGRRGRNPQVAPKLKKGRQEDKYESYEIDKDKLSDRSRVREQEADDSEVLVIELIKTALEEVVEPDDPPVVVLHSQFLTSKTNSGTSAEQFKIDKNKGEMDILILHPSFGILIVEVKSSKTIDFSPLDKATTQLIRSQTSIQEEMGDLLEKDATILTIALPNLGPEASSDIRKEAEERKRKKQASDAKEGTGSTERQAAVTSDTGTKKQTAIASTASDFKHKKELLEDHPEILLLCGSTLGKEWVTHLMELRTSAGHAFKGSTDDERATNHREACVRRLSVAGLRPGESVKDSAALHRRFLLTEEQLHVRDSQAHLLHVWGPPGSGKTLLLAERARRWIREGRRVALAVGNLWYTSLLHQLTRSVFGDKTDVARVSTHTTNTDLLERLDAASTADPVFVIVDEADGVDYSRLLSHVTSGRVAGLWTANTADLHDRYKAAWQAEGGTTVQLQLCLRCPPSVMALSNAVGGTSYPRLLSPPVPVTRELGVGVEVISHADHGQSQPCKKCPTCREGVKNFFSSLGLLGDDVTSSLSLSQCVVIITGGYIDRKGVVEFLGGLGLRAVAEDIPYTPVLLPGQTPQSRDEARDDARSRVVAGVDVEGRPVIHVVSCVHFLGLERDVVVVWHQDWNDEDEKRQGRKHRDVIKDFHRRDWFRAVTRCQGRLLLVVDTPSPLLSELPASSPAHDQAKSSSSSPLSSPSSSSDVKAAEKRHSAGTDPTQSATSP